MPREACPASLPGSRLPFVCEILCKVAVIDVADTVGELFRQRRRGTRGGVGSSLLRVSSTGDDRADARQLCEPRDRRVGGSHTLLACERREFVRGFDAPIEVNAREGFADIEGGAGAVVV